LREMIADRTYHRLLNVDWIQADINGDGSPEYVPRTDQTGPKAPTHSYALSTQQPTSALQAPGKSGFYVGGTIYSDWASVPARYKSSFSQDPDAGRSTASIFRFTW
jgi:polar amino acid transport system substrate-binding protein